MLRRQFSFGLAGSVFLGGCGPLWKTNHQGSDRPRFDSQRRASGIAWVFSSGGPRGFVHIGVLKALDEMGLKPNLLVGASAGSLVCALYACGVSGKELEELSMSFNPLKVLRLNVRGDERLDGAGLAQLVNDRVEDRLIEQLPIPLVCLALNKASNTLVPFNCGNTGLAVQASCAIDGQFAPVLIDGQLYGDPDLVQPLPVRTALQSGAQKVLAIDASAHEDRRPAGAERFEASDKRKREITEPDAKAANLTLHPYFGYWVSITAEFRQRAIVAGYEHTMQQRKQIEALYRI